MENIFKYSDHFTEEEILSLAMQEDDMHEPFVPLNENHKHSIINQANEENIRLQTRDACSICGRFFATKNILYEQVSFLDNVKHRLSHPENLPRNLKRAYDISMFPKCEHLNNVCICVRKYQILNKHTMTCPKIAICKDHSDSPCLRALLDKTSTLPPKFAYANNFCNGRDYYRKLFELNIAETILINPMRLAMNVFIFHGKKPEHIQCGTRLKKEQGNNNISLKGNQWAVESDLDYISKSLPDTTNFHLVLPGKKCSELLSTLEPFTIRTDKVKSAILFLVKNNLTCIERNIQLGKLPQLDENKCIQGTILHDDDGSLARATKGIYNSNNVDKRHHADNTDIVITRQPHQDTLNDANSALLTVLKQLSVPSQKNNVYSLESSMPPVNIGFIHNLFVQFFPFARGGSNEKRSPSVSFESWARSELKRGLDDQHFVLACNNMQMVRSSKQRIYGRVNYNKNNPRYSLKCLTTDVMRTLSEYVESRESACRKRQRLPEIPTILKEHGLPFLRAIEAIRSKTKGTNEETKDFRNKYKSISDCFGIPTLFVTIAVDETRKKWVLTFRKQLNFSMDSDVSITYHRKGVLSDLQEYINVRSVFIKYILGWDEEAQLPFKHMDENGIINSSGLFGIPSAAFSATETETRRMVHDHWVIFIPHIQRILTNMFSPQKELSEMAQHKIITYIDQVMSTNVLNADNIDSKTCTECNAEIKQMEIKGAHRQLQKRGREIDSVICLNGHSTSSTSFLIKKLRQAWITETGDVHSFPLSESSADATFKQRQDAKLKIDTFLTNIGPTMTKLELSILKTYYLSHPEWHTPGCFKAKVSKAGNHFCRYRLMAQSQCKTALCEDKDETNDRTKIYSFNIQRDAPSGYISAHTPGITEFARCNTNTLVLLNDIVAFYTCNYTTKQKFIRNGEFRQLIERIIEYMKRKGANVTELGLLLSAQFHFSKVDIIEAHMAGLFCLGYNRFFSTHKIRLLFLSQLIAFCKGKNLHAPMRRINKKLIHDAPSFDFLYRDYRLRHYCYYEFTMYFCRCQLRRDQYVFRDQNEQNDDCDIPRNFRAEKKEVFFFRSNHIHFKSSHGLFCTHHAVPRILVKGNTLDDLRVLQRHENESSNEIIERREEFALRYITLFLCNLTEQDDLSKIKIHFITFWNAYIHLQQFKEFFVFGKTYHLWKNAKTICSNIQRRCYQQQKSKSLNERHMIMEEIELDKTADKEDPHRFKLHITNSCDEPCNLDDMNGTSANDIVDALSNNTMTFDAPTLVPGHSTKLPNFIIKSTVHSTQTLKDKILNIKRIDESTDNAIHNKNNEGYTLLRFIETFVSRNNSDLESAEQLSETNASKSKIPAEILSNDININNITNLEYWEKSLDNEQKAGFKLFVYCYLDSWLHSIPNKSSYYIKLHNIIKSNLPILKKCDATSPSYKQETSVFAFITGAAGCGKSSCLNKFRSYARVLNETFPSIPNDIVCVVAPTGIAACLIGGETIDMRIFADLGQTKKLDTENISFFRREIFANLGILVIDELSMVPPKKLAKIDIIFRALFDEKKLFGGIHVILLGDLYQLPAIKSPPYYAPYHENIIKGSTQKHDLNSHGINLFQHQLNCSITLCTPHRFQNDAKWADVLSRIRTGEPTPQDIDYINQRYTTMPGHVNGLATSAEVAYYNKTVHAKTRQYYHHFLSQKKFLCVRATYFLDNSNNTTNDNTARLLSHFLRDDDSRLTHGLCPNLYLYKDAHFRITNNLSTNNGLANGMIISFQNIVFKQNAVATTEHHENYGTYLCYNACDVEYIIIKLCVSHLKDKQLILNFEKGQTIMFPFPKTQRSKLGRCFKKTQKMKRMINNMTFTFRMQQFPLYPSWVTTGHTVQGRSLSHIIISQMHLSLPWLYVVLSRASTHAGVTLLEKLDHAFYEKHVRNKHLHNLHIKLLHFHKLTMRHYHLNDSQSAALEIKQIRTKARKVNLAQSSTHLLLQRGDESFRDFTYKHSHDKPKSIFYFALIRTLQSTTSAPWITNLNTLLKHGNYQILKTKTFTFKNMASYLKKRFKAKDIDYTSSKNFTDIFRFRRNVHYNDRIPALTEYFETQIASIFRTDKRYLTKKTFIHAATYIVPFAFYARLPSTSNAHQLYILLLACLDPRSELKDSCKIRKNNGPKSKLLPFYDIILAANRTNKTYCMHIKALKNMHKKKHSSNIIQSHNALPCTLPLFAKNVFKHAKRHKSTYSLTHAILFTSFPNHKLYESYTISFSLLYVSPQNELKLSTIARKTCFANMIPYLHEISDKCLAPLPCIINYCNITKSYDLFTTHHHNSKSLDRITSNNKIQNYTHSALSELVNDGYLHDEIINRYFDILTQINFDYYHLSTHFYQKLTAQGTNQHEIKRWLQNYKTRINYCKILFIPVHVHSNHWILLLVNFPFQSIICYDSLSSHSNQHTHVMKNIAFTLHTHGYTNDLITNLHHAECSQQINGVDCGVFVCQFAYLAVKEQPLHINPLHTRQLRQYIFKVLMYKSFSFTSQDGLRIYHDACDKLNHS